MLDLDFIFGNAPWPVEVTTTPTLTALEAHDSDAGLGVILMTPDLQPQDGDAGEWTERKTADGWIVERAEVAGLEIIDLPTPCPVCDGIVFWWDAAGGVHCERCDPRTRATWLREHAQRLRERHERNPRR